MKAWVLKSCSLGLVLAACVVSPLTPTPEIVPSLPPIQIVQVVFTPTVVPSSTATSAVTAELPAVPTVTAGLPTPEPSATEPAAVATAPPWTPLPVSTEGGGLVALPVMGDVAAAEQYTIDLINAQRAAVGVGPLLRDEMLMTIARSRVADMIARGYVGHTDPVTGEHLARTMMRAAGYTSTYLGENWYGTVHGPPDIVDIAMGWFMTDPPHANNILSPNYAWVGVGIGFNGQQWLLIQNFAGANP